MASLTKLTAYRDLLFGAHVARATATLPQTTHSAIFTIAGGRVIVTAIIGEVTTAIQNQANNTKLTAYPTTGTAADMCAVTSIANKEVGTLLSITGLATDALATVSSGFVKGITYDGIIVDVGAIHLDCAASNTGSIKWDLFYVPLDDAGVVTAA